MQSAKRGLSHGDSAEKGASVCMRKPAGKEISVWNTQAFAERFPRSYPPKALLSMPAVSQPAIATMSHCFDATLGHCGTRSKTLAIEHAKSISARYYIDKLNVLSSKYLSPPPGGNPIISAFRVSDEGQFGLMAFSALSQHKWQAGNKDGLRKGRGTSFLEY